MKDIPMDDELYHSDPRANTLEGFIFALNILAKYMPEKEKSSYFFGAEHDIIHIYDVDIDDLPEDSEDGKILNALGFHIEDDSWAYFT